MRASTADFEPILMDKCLQDDLVRRTLLKSAPLAFFDRKRGAPSKDEGDRRRAAACSIATVEKGAAARICS